MHVKCIWPLINASHTHTEIPTITVHLSTTSYISSWHFFQSRFLPISCPKCTCTCVHCFVWPLAGRMHWPLLDKDCSYVHLNLFSEPRFTVMPLAVSLPFVVPSSLFHPRRFWHIPARERDAHSWPQERSDSLLEERKTLFIAGHCSFMLMIINAIPSNCKRKHTSNILVSRWFLHV